MEPDYRNFVNKLRAALRVDMETISTQRVLELAGEVGIHFLGPPAHPRCRCSTGLSARPVSDL